MGEPNVDTEAMARLLYETECAERRKQIPDEPLYSWEGLPEESRRLNRVLAQALIAARDAQWRDRIAILEAALARAEAALRAIRDEVEPVRTRRVRRNGNIKALVDAVLATPTA